MAGYLNDNDYDDDADDDGDDDDDDERNGISKRFNISWNIVFFLLSNLYSV